MVSGVNRRLVYRLYLLSPGWRVTRWMRKGEACERCEAETRLELHHRGYGWHNRNRFWRWIFPNLIDPMETLCADCHRLEHRKNA